MAGLHHGKLGLQSPIMLGRYFCKDKAADHQKAGLRSPLRPAGDQIFFHSAVWQRNSSVTGRKCSSSRKSEVGRSENCEQFASQNQVRSYLQVPFSDRPDTSAELLSFHASLTKLETLWFFYSLTDFGFQHGLQRGDLCRGDGGAQRGFR